MNHRLSSALTSRLVLRAVATVAFGRCYSRRFGARHVQVRPRSMGVGG